MDLYYKYDNENDRPNTSGIASDISTATLVPSEMCIVTQENLEIFIIIYSLVTDDGKESGDFQSLSKAGPD
jgi:hypothetical protein